MTSLPTRAGRRPVARSRAWPILALLAVGCDSTAIEEAGLPPFEELAREVGAVAAPTEEERPAESRVLLEEAPYLGTVQSEDGRTVPLPGRLERPDGFTLITAAPLPAPELAQRIAEIADIPVVLDMRLPDARARADANAAAIRYQGALSGFLDILSRQWDVEWTYLDGVISIADMIYRSYPVHASAALSSLSLRTADSNADTGSLSTGVQLETAAWQEIDANLASLVRPGRYSLSPGAGLVGVHAPPSVQAAVRSYLDKTNKIFGARIVIEVAAAFLDVTGLDDYSASLDFLSQALGDRAKLSLGRSGLVQNGIVARFQISENIGGSAARFAGTTAALQALSRTDRVIDYRTANAITRHGSPVPIRLSRRQDIVRRISVVTNGETSTTAIEPETIDTGLSITIHPRLVESGRVHLTLSLSASALVNLVPFRSSGDEQVQLATVDERRLTHDLVIDEDELAVLAGYEQRRASQLHEGVGAPKNMLLGGSDREEAVNSRLFLFVTARRLR